jgi:streptogramin lyase
MGRSRAWACAITAALLVVSCAEPAPHQSVRPAARPERVTTIPLPGSGYVFDVAISEEAAWVTSHAGLYRVDPYTGNTVNVLPVDYLFRVVSGHSAIWISTGSDGRVLRVDPETNEVVAEIEIGAGPVTELAISEEAVWVSAVSDLVRLDPVTNEIVARLRDDGGFGDVAYGEGALWIVAGANQDGAVWRIDPTTNRVQLKRPLPDPHFMNEIAVGEGAVWVTTSPTVRGDDTALVRLHRIDPLTGDMVAEVPVGTGASGLGAGERAASYSALAVGEGSVWVLVNWDGSLARIDPESTASEIVEGFAADPSSDTSSGLTLGAGAAWVTSSKAVMRVDLRG